MAENVKTSPHYDFWLPNLAMHLTMFDDLKQKKKSRVGLASPLYEILAFSRDFLGIGEHEIMVK